MELTSLVADIVRGDAPPGRVRAVKQAATNAISQSWFVRDPTLNFNSRIPDFEEYGSLSSTIQKFIADQKCKGDDMGVPYSPSYISETNN